VACCAAVASLLPAGGALAAFPGTNGEIAFVQELQTAPANGDIFVIDPTGLNPTSLTSTADDDDEPSYSADGERIVFSRRPASGPSSQIWIMNHDGSGQTQLTSGSAGDFRPAFSRDGERIAFARNVPGPSTQIWIMNADGTGQTQLTFPGPNGDSARSPTFSPDGQRIAFSHDDGATDFQGIWVMNADGSGQTPLTTGSATSEDFSPNFSPDGERIVFFRGSFSEFDFDLIAMNAADGSGQTPVTSGADNDLDPAFSPDGARIAFEREEPPGFTFGNILLVDAVGLNQNLTPLTANASGVYDLDPDWQPLNPPSCDLAGEAKQKSVKQVSVTVTCANENATVVAEGSGRAPKAPKGAVASKAKKFTIPAVSAQVPAGTPTTLTLKIPKKGSKALKKAAKAGKKGKATITATLTDDLGLTASDSFKVKFKAKKK
jgi:TolB protein